MARRKSIGNLGNLNDRITLVTGASRGAGRGIAAVLGECGATVYVTGRSELGKPTPDKVSGTIQETADEVTRRGGKGIAVRCDHANLEDVEHLFQRIRNEQGRLDVLVNNAWGGYEGGLIRPAFFWNTPIHLWDAMIERGLKAHLLATYFAVPLMIETGKTKRAKRPGLIVSTVAWDHDKYIGNFYDLAKHSIVRFLWGLAQELKDFNVATVALAPGFMRTERVMSHAGEETDWKKLPWLKRSESPEYVGRAVAALASDRHLMRKTGKVFHVGELARKFGFTDVDGRRVPPFIIREPFIKMVKRLEELK